MHSAAGTRLLVWVDVAKAICACLVVIMHGEAQIAVVGWANPEKVMAGWHAINAFLQPIRMPTFFTISGLLASALLDRNREDSFRKGFAQPLYLYLVWAVIFAVVVPKYPYLDNDATVSMWERIRKIFFLGSPAWYLYALAIYFLAARITSRWSNTLVFSICSLLSICSAVLMPDQNVYASKLCHCLFFFMAGVRFKGQLINFCEMATPRRCLLLLAVYIPMFMLSKVISLHLLLVDIAAVAFSLLTFGLLSRHLGSFTPAVQWVGRHSLHIYVLQFPLMLVFGRSVQAWAGTTLLEHPLLGLAYPLVLAALVVPTSLAAGVIMKKIGLTALFALQKRSKRMEAIRIVAPPSIVSPAQ